MKRAPLTSAAQTAAKSASNAIEIILDAVSRDRIPAADRVQAAANLQRIADRLNRIASRIEQADRLHNLPVVPGHDSGLR